MGETLTGIGSFSQGLINLSNWVGNVFLPLMTVVCVCLAAWSYAHRRDGGRYIVGGFACLTASGLVRLAESFVEAGSGSTQYYTALLTMVNYLGNVVMPMYAGVEVFLGVLAWSGFGDRLYIGDDWSRHLLVAMLCVAISGAVRMMEWMI